MRNLNVPWRFPVLTEYALRSARDRGRGRFSPRISAQNPLEKCQSSCIVRHILSFSAKSKSNCRKCPTFSQSICPCFLCFHTHSRFQRHLLTSFLLDLPPAVSFNWNRIFTIERRPDCCRLDMGSAFSSPDARLPTDYTHQSRLCQENSEATLRRRPWPRTGPVSAQGPSASAPPGVRHADG